MTTPARPQITSNPLTGKSVTSTTAIVLLWIGAGLAAISAALLAANTAWIPAIAATIGAAMCAVATRTGAARYAWLARVATAATFLVTSNEGASWTVFADMLCAAAGGLWPGVTHTDINTAPSHNQKR